MSRLVVLLPWTAVLVVVVGSLFNGQQVIVDEPIGLTAWLLGAAPVTLLLALLLPWAPGRRRLWRASGFVIVTFAALLLWAAIRAVGVTRCLNLRDGEVIGVCFPNWVAWVPLAQTAVTAALAWLVVAYVPRARLDRWTVALALGLVAMTSVALLRALADPRGFNRLSSGLGGAAVLSVALIIAAAWLFGHHLRRPRWHLLVAAAVAVALLVLTFSRAGLAVALLAAAALAWAVRDRLGRAGRRVAVGVVAVAATAGVAAAVVFPDLAGRLLTLGDEGRAINLHTALGAWLTDPGHAFLGLGTAGVWPWFAVDNDLVWAPETGLLGVTGIEGELLVNPHSTFLGIAVELGIVGLALWLAVIWFIVRAAARVRHTSAAGFGLVAAAACVVAFLFDTYLLRNPGISFIWWCAVFAGLGCSVTGRRRATSQQPSGDAEPGQEQ